ncbi:MAG: hypothetical protein AB1349_00130, partial [Elusimicrobiota bacterium]
MDNLPDWLLNIKKLYHFVVADLPARIISNCLSLRAIAKQAMRLLQSLRSFAMTKRIIETVPILLVLIFNFTVLSFNCQKVWASVVGSGNTKWSTQRHVFKGKNGYFYVFYIDAGLEAFAYKSSADGAAWSDATAVFPPGSYPQADNANGAIWYNQNERTYGMVYVVVGNKNVTPPAQGAGAAVTYAYIQVGILYADGTITWKASPVTAAIGCTSTAWLFTGGAVNICKHPDPTAVKARNIIVAVETHDSGTTSALWAMGSYGDVDPDATPPTVGMTPAPAGALGAQ